MEGKQLGPYRILSALGSGGMGRVFLAEVAGKAPELAAGTQVALKIIHPHLLEQPGFFKRFLREAEIGRSVRHKNVVRCHDCDAVLYDGVQQNFLVMELVAGQTLRGLLDDLQQVPEELCRHVGLEVARGLAAIHEAGVVHRDLKPENVLITADYLVKIMDLGVARLLDEAVRLSQTGAFVGSLEYAAPEQLHSSGAAPDGRSDLHALGVVLYELATGRHPFRADDARRVLRRILDDAPRKVGDLNPQLSPFLEEVVATLLAKEPDERFGSAAEVARILKAGEDSTWWRDRARALRAETNRPLRRIRIPRATALYGRERELEQLVASYEEARAGEGRAVLIEGEAGIGKTRIVDEFVGRLREAGEDFNFLFGSYPPGGAATAAGAFSTAYREHFGRDGLENALEPYLKATPVLVRAFAALLRGESTPTGAEGLTKDSLQTVFVHATRGLAAERPTIVLIDDLHFAPEEGRALFSALAAGVPGHRILLVGALRPGVPASWASSITHLEHARHVHLPRLGAKDLALLLREAFHSERLADELGTKIAVKSDGNPFFAFEIIRGLREGQFITRQPDGRWVSTQHIQDVEVPSSVTDLVQARIADLGVDQKNLLDVGACCGFEFDPLLVARVLGLDEIPALQSLARVERRHRLIRSAGPRFLFDHHQVQEALYDGLPEPLRERYHAAIARAIEQRADACAQSPDALPGALCVSLCEHYLDGAEGDRALRYLGTALTHLERGFLNDQASALADRALAVPGLLSGKRRFRVLMRKGSRLELMGRRAEQAAVLAQAGELAREIGQATEQSRVEEDLGVLAMWTGNLEDALTHQARALALLQGSDDRKGQISVLGNLGNVHCALGHYPEARKHQERHLALAREFEDREAEAAASINLGIVAKHSGELDRAKELYECGLELARRSGNHRWEANAHGNLANLLHGEGRHEEARATTEKALELFRMIGDRRGESGCIENIGLFHMALGRATQAQESFERCLSLSRELGDREGEARATWGLGSVLRSQDRLGEALAHFERAVSLLSEVGSRLREAHAALSAGAVLVLLGQQEPARATLERALVLAQETRARAQEGDALYRLAQLADEAGDLAAAIRLVDRGLRLLRGISATGTADALFHLGTYRWRAGDSAGARAALEEAAALSEEASGGVGGLARVYLACRCDADAEAARNAWRSAAPGEHAMRVRYLLWTLTGEVEHLREAKRLLDYRVEHSPLEFRDAMLTKVRLHRNITEAWRSAGGAGRS